MPNASHPFAALLQKRIVVLDGAMGTTLHRLGLTEADYRGERFRNWKGKDLKGAIELLLLTKPEAVERVNDPGFRAVTFDQIKQSYRDQIDALLAGGVYLLLVETVFDTLNAKAALFAIAEAFEKNPIPLIVSGTITDRSGRTLSGQTLEAFLTSITHAN